MNTQLWQQVANALSDSPAQQPVTNAGKVDSEPENGEKANSKAGTTSGYKAKQKGNPNRSYTVSVINKAKAKIG